MKNSTVAIGQESLHEIDTLLSSYSVFQKTYYNRPDAFARHCVNWDSEELTSYQIEFLGKIPEKKRVSIRSPHGAGKTAVAALSVLWFVLTRDGWKDWKVGMTASAWRQLTHFLMPEIKKWSGRIIWEKIGRKPFDMSSEFLKQNIKLSSGEAFCLASDNPSYLEGLHGEEVMYILDEAKVIPDETWDAIEGAFSTGVCYAVALSTPGEPKGRFYEIHSRAPGYEDWSVLYVTLDMAVKAGRINAQWAEQRRKQWGEESAVYKNRVLGQFATSDEDGVISLADVERANIRWQERNDAGAWDLMTGLGVDIGRGGDPSVLAREYDGNGIKELTRIQTRNSMKIAGLITGILRAMHRCVAVIDLGYDPGVYDRAREGTGGDESMDADIRARIKPFVASSKCDFTDASGELSFTNLRSAAWWNLRERLRADEYDLPPDDKLTGDLTAPKYAIKSGGKIQVEGKGETSISAGLRAKLQRSTDDGDAVVMIAMKKNIAADDDELDDMGQVDDFQSRWE